MTGSGTGTPEKPETHVDFSLHGVIGIRLCDATPTDVHSVSRQLGQSPSALHADPDIVIRFVDEFRHSDLTFLGLRSTAFADGRFFILDPVSGAVDAQIPFDTIGAGCDIGCRRGLASIPLLPDILNLCFQAKGFVALHGSAFRLDGRNVLIAGWEKGGKTETLLAFVTKGAQFIGDEMILLSADGKTMFGIPIPIAVWDWQMPYLRNMVPKAGIGQKAVFKAIHMLGAIQRRFDSGRPKPSRPMAILRKAMPSLQRQLRNWYRPAELFADRISTQTSGPDQIILISSHDKPAITVTSCDPMEVADRMRSSNEYERSHIYQYYRAFKFAFPDRRNELLESLDDMQATMLRSALLGKTAYRLSHPYPVSLDDLYDAMHPYLTGAQQDID